MLLWMWSAPVARSPQPGAVAPNPHTGHIAAMLRDQILFIDAEAMIVDKPAGLGVDAGRDGKLSLENHLDLLRFGFQRHPSAVHRLDRDTSGCLLLARHPKAHKKFSAAFEAGVVEKLYWAVVEGVPDASSGTIDMALGKTSTREAGWRIVPDAKGKAARTHWRVLRSEGGRTLIEFRPETGRTHQIRVHAASGLGLPIVGDPVYGRAGPAMLLHARFLSLPRDGKPPVEAKSPLPETFVAAGFGDETAGDIPSGPEPADAAA
jgi:tRNA pseudouridine32 synthase/23S rRNA pseudouridine746 synthase